MTNIIIYIEIVCLSIDESKYMGFFALKSLVLWARILYYSSSSNLQFNSIASPS
jgi:hypothetical protein